MELLDHRVILFLIFRETAIQFYLAAKTACKHLKFSNFLKNSSHSNGCEVIYHCGFFFIVNFIYLFIFFHCTAWGLSYTYTYTFFSPLFVLLQYKYLDTVLNATQQDLLVNSFQVVSDNPKFPIPPTPSLSPWAAKSLLSLSMILFSVKMFICAVY